jgi:DNA-binding XRE family transcriptional regulator
VTRDGPPAFAALGAVPSAPIDRRLSGRQARSAAALLERQGWRAQTVALTEGVALVEVRATGVRGMPLVAVLRTPADVEAFRRAHPDRAAGARPEARRVRPAASRSGVPGSATIVALRRAAGLGQRALAERRGVSKTTLADVERGRRGGPQARQLALRAVALLRGLPHEGEGLPSLDGARRMEHDRDPRV